MSPQERQKTIDLKASLLKCYLAEMELATFLVEKADLASLDTDATFKLKWLVDRVTKLIREVQASDDNLQGKASDIDYTAPWLRLCQVLVWCRNP